MLGADEMEDGGRERGRGRLYYYVKFLGSLLGWKCQMN